MPGRKGKSNFSKIRESKQREITSSKKATSTFSNSPLTFKMPAKESTTASAQAQKSLKKGFNLRSKNKRKSTRR